jgi:CRISPR-associated protein (TIGR03984 family)
MKDNGKNVLKVSPIKTNVTHGTCSEQTVFDTISKQLQGTSYSAFFMMDHAVCIGKYTNNTFILPPGLSFEPVYLIGLRIFNCEEELYIWRLSNQELGYRHRDEVSMQGEEAEVIDAAHLLWGSVASFNGDNEWVILKDSRGIELIIPAEGYQIGSRVLLKTRNYIKDNPLGQYGYVDCRFMKLIREEDYSWKRA